MNDKKGKNNSGIFVGVLTIILILTYIYTLKNYEPAKNLLVSGGILFYPLTFYITAMTFNRCGFKTAKNNIFKSSTLYVLFILLIMLASFFNSSNMTSAYDSIIKYVFVNNVVDIGNIHVFYPTIGQFVAVLLPFIVSNLLFLTTFKIAKDATNEYLAFGLSIFISCIIDRLLFIPILYAKGLVIGANTFDFVIRCLTSEFIFYIMISMLLTVVYAGYSLIKKA